VEVYTFLGRMVQLCGEPNYVARMTQHTTLPHF